jgi:hypothetical protein
MLSPRSGRPTEPSSLCVFARLVSYRSHSGPLAAHGKGRLTLSSTSRRVLSVGMVGGLELLSRVLSFNDALREVGSSSSLLVSFARVVAAHAGVFLFYYF